jgi:hypothetical protein
MSYDGIYLITLQGEVPLFYEISKATGLELHVVDVSPIFNWNDLVHDIDNEDRLIAEFGLSIPRADTKVILLLHTFSKHVRYSETLRANELSFLVHSVEEKIPIVMFAPSLAISREADQPEAFNSKPDAFLIRTLLNNGLVKLVTVDGPVEAFEPDIEHFVHNLSTAQLFVNSLTDLGDNQFVLMPIYHEDINVLKDISAKIPHSRIGSALVSMLSLPSAEVANHLNIKPGEKTLIYSRRITHISTIKSLKTLPLDFHHTTLCCSHLDLPSNQALSLAEVLSFRLVTTDSIFSPGISNLPNVEILSLSSLFDEVLKNIANFNSGSSATDADDASSA